VIRESSHPSFQFTVERGGYGRISIAEGASSCVFPKVSRDIARYDNKPKGENYYKLAQSG
jgi:hypothetical protein